VLLCQSMLAGRERERRREKEREREREKREREREESWDQFSLLCCPSQHAKANYCRFCPDKMAVFTIIILVVENQT